MHTMKHAAKALLLVLLCVGTLLYLYDNGPWLWRVAQRSSAERANSALKDSYSARFVRVRGAAKVLTHLMFGVIAFTAAQIVRLIC